MRLARLLRAGGHHAHDGAHKSAEYGGACARCDSQRSRVLSCSRLAAAAHYYPLSAFFFLLPGFHAPHVNPLHRNIGVTLGAIMWFWIFYRAREDGPVVLGWRHPWDHAGHDDHGDGHGDAAHGDAAHGDGHGDAAHGKAAQLH